VFLLLFDAMAGTVQTDNLGMIKGPIEHRGCGHCTIGQRLHAVGA
jgi:hypothetical protein